MDFRFCLLHLSVAFVNFFDFLCYRYFENNQEHTILCMNPFFWWKREIYIEDISIVK